MPKFSVSTGAASFFEAFSRPLQKSRGARSWEPKRRENASKKEAAPVLTENFGITREYQLHLQGGSQLGSPIFLLPRPYTRTGHAHTHTHQDQNPCHEEAAPREAATRRRHPGPEPCKGAPTWGVPFVFAAPSTHKDGAGIHFMCVCRLCSAATLQDAAEASALPSICKGAPNLGAPYAFGGGQGAPNWGAPLLLQPRPHTRTGLQCTAGVCMCIHQHRT